MSPDTSPAVDHLRETLVERRPVFAGKLLRVHEDRVRLPGGGTATREVVEHPGAVAVVAVTRDSQVLLVRQWRHAAGGALWEVPAGTRDRGEDALATARRELAEETGFSATSWNLLGQANVSPGYSDEVLTFFLAKDLTEGETHTDADEQLDVRPFAGPEVAELVRTGGTDCKTLGGLALAGLLPALRRPR